MDNSGGVSKTPAKSGARKTTSCGECQRRKQKCDRQWPCNQCTARRRVHLCRFETKKRRETPSKQDSGSVLYSAIQSSRNSDDDRGSPKSADGDAEETEKPFNIAAMGFGSGASIIADLKELDIHDPPHEVSSSTRTALTLLCAVPPRPYANLWKERNREKWDLNFAALLLQMCAIAVQFLPEKDQATIEELNPSRRTLSRNYIDASEKLLDLGVPGTCVERVQAHYLMSFWLKNEGRAPHGWHRLSRAVREAQELQLHVDPSEDKFTDFDAQLRRYVWMSIRTIDNHFSRALSRPRMITNSSCCVAMPLSSFEGADGLDPTGPAPSPTVQPWYEHKLSALFSDEEYSMFMVGDDGGDMEAAERFSQMADRVLNWVDKLPAFLKRAGDPDCDKHWDEQAPYLPIQRAHMHSQVHHVLSSIYRPYMSLSYSRNKDRSRNSNDSRRKSQDPKRPLPCLQLRHAGVANALALLQANQEFFETLQPHHYASAPLSFHPFEPSAHLCMFLLTEPSLDPQLYDRVIDAVSSVIERYSMIKEKIACGCPNERNELGWFADNAQTVLKALMRKVEAANATTRSRQHSLSTTGSAPTKVPIAKEPTLASEGSNLSHDSHSNIGGASGLPQTLPSQHNDHTQQHYYQGADAYGRELGFMPTFDYNQEVAAATADAVAEDPHMEWNFDLNSDMVRSMMTPSFTFDPSDYDIDL